MKRKKKGLKHFLSLAMVPALPLLCLTFPLLQDEDPGALYTAQTTAVLYAAPDRSADILSTLSPGTTATVFDVPESGWQRLETEDGISGYIWNPAASVAEDAAPTPRPVKADPVPYSLTCAAALFRQADKNSDVLRHLNSGEALELTGAVKNGMVMAKLQDGTLGFLDSTLIDKNAAAELVSILGGSRSPQGVQNLFSAENMLLPFADRLLLLRELFPDGRHWNTLGYDTGGLSQEWAVTLTTDKPCAHTDNGYQYCQTYTGKLARQFTGSGTLQNPGFVSMASDFLFGKDAPIRIHQDLTALQPGDLIRFSTTEKFVLVTQVLENSISTAFCNNDDQNCKITWDRVYEKKELEVQKLDIVTRREQAAGAVK